MTVELAGIRPGQSVLDVGCGTGSLTLAARAAVGASGQVSGIDPSPEMIDVARKKATKARSAVDFREGVIEAIPFPDASFDVVLSSLMLHHLPHDLKRKGFEEIARVLKPGGVFLAVDMAGGSHGLLGHLLGGRAGHKQPNGLSALPPMLTAAGFQDAKAGPTKVRMLGFLSGRRP